MMFLNVFVLLTPTLYVIYVTLPCMLVYAFLCDLLERVEGNLFFVLLKPTSELKVRGSAAGFNAVQALRTGVTFALSFGGWYLPFDIFPRQSIVETVSFLPVCCDSGSWIS